MDISKIKNEELVPWVEKVENNKKDIQGLITRGYKSLHAARYILLKITEAPLAKKYFKSLVPLITNVDKDDKQLTGNDDPTEAVQIAFTSSGLKALKLPDNILETFSREFIEGMTFIDTGSPSPTKNERSVLLGDVGNNDPKWWAWGNADHPVHCMIMLYAVNSASLDMLTKKVYSDLKEGVDLAFTGETFENKEEILKEHFGFMDGISQPLLKGLRKSEEQDDDKRKWINLGEIILGYENEYNNYSPSPYIDSCEDSDLPILPRYAGKRDLGKNGTYLVFRQMEQHVERFWKFLYDHSKENNEKKDLSMEGKAIKLGSKMIGRWPEGQPLVTCPDGGCPMSDLNDFNYDAADKDGANCPLGAHIRRTNPRDQVHTGRNLGDSLEMSKKHRILRRGRIYGEPLDEKLISENMISQVKEKPLPVSTEGKTEIIRGLHFICLVSDIGRQFEFVQNVWANTASFADLCNEVDPIISPRPTDDQPDCHEFTTPQELVRNRYNNVPQFTTVVGGAYFFMPGINAFKYLIK